jgi:hypothetical protein
MTSSDASKILAKLKIDVDADFHALSWGKVAKLLAEADRVSYRCPRGALGSRARYFLNRLQRLARRKED